MNIGAYQLIDYVDVVVRRVLHDDGLQFTQLKVDIYSRVLLVSDPGQGVKDLADDLRNLAVVLFGRIGVHLDGRFRVAILNQRGIQFELFTAAILGSFNVKFRLAIDGRVMGGKFLAGIPGSYLLVKDG